MLVDLTDGTIQTRDTMKYARDYIGGRGLGVALAWEMLRPGIGPLDPENPLMFLGGPLAGTSAPVVDGDNVHAREGRRVVVLRERAMI